jgi:hypothetical protein
LKDPKILKLKLNLNRAGSFGWEINGWVSDEDQNDKEMKKSH